VITGVNGALEVLQPTEWGLDHILGKGWEFQHEKERFGELLETALVINPKSRPTAAELLERNTFVKPSLVAIAL